MSLKVSSSRYYCPGPGQVQYESCPQCSFINVQWHVVVFIIFWTLLYYEKDIMSWSAGIANMSPIPKVIIPSFSWIMVFLWFLGTPLSCRVCTHPDVSLLQPLHPGDADDVRDPTLCQWVAIPAHLRCNPSRHIYSPE